MARIFVKFGDIARHRFVDACLQPVHQRRPAPNRWPGVWVPPRSDWSMSSRLLGCSRSSAGVQFGIEIRHVGKALRRIQVEDPHQTVITVERLIPPILHHA